VTIHVTLKSSAPLFKACGIGISLAGLTGSCTDIAAYTQAEDYLTFQSFDKATGALLVEVNKDTKGGCTYAMNFDLTHSSIASNGVQPTVTVSPTGILIGNTNMDVPGISEAARPMKIQDLSFSYYEIFQSSSMPCDVNTLSVTLRTDQTNFHAACTTKITIEGLASTLTPAGAIATHWTWAGADDIVVTKNDVMGELLESGGKKSLEVDLPVGPSSNWKVHFDLDNPKSASSCSATYLKISMASCITSEVQRWSGTGNDNGRLNTYAPEPPEKFAETLYDQTATEAVRAADDYCPFHIRANSITTRNIGQSSVCFCFVCLCVCVRVCVCVCISIAY
jgi:hypothetical protein